jgi:hypothetical protein
MRLGLSFILMICLCLQRSFPQSCIVYKKDKDGIFIGADTRAVSYSSNVTTKQVETNYLSLCKIQQVNNINFATTGYGGPASLAEARSACEKEKLLADAVKLYAESFGQALANLLEADRITKNDLFKAKFPQGQTVGGSIFFQYENDSLVGRAVKFILTTSATEKVIVRTRTEYMDSIGIMGSSIGIHRVFYNKDIWKKGPVNGINNLINIEKMANPAEVSGVADILFVSRKNEVEWIQRKKCQ